MQCAVHRTHDAECGISATVNSSRKYWNWGVILLDNLDRERKTLLFTAHRIIFACEACVSYYFSFVTYTFQEKATLVLVKLMIAQFESQWTDTEETYWTISQHPQNYIPSRTFLYVHFFTYKTGFSSISLHDLTSRVTSYLFCLHWWIVVTHCALVL